MTWQTYRELGGIEGALAASADAVLAEYYTTEQREALRQLLVRLIQPGEGSADTRRRVRLDDLVPAGASLDTIQSLVKPLADARLLTTSRDNITKAETVEISHEALIRAWPTFRRWIDEARADLRFRLQLEEAAKEWEARNKDASVLYRGAKFVETRERLTFNKVVLSR